MSTLDEPTRLRVTYEAHAERLIRSMPAHHHDTLRSVLRHPVHVEQVVRVLVSKAKLTASDGRYHNAIFGGPSLGITGRFTVFEVGCTPSFAQFEKYLHQLGYDDYPDYFSHVLVGDGKGLALYAKQTGEPIPEDVATSDFLERFIVGHVLCDRESNTLVLAIQWQLADGGLTIFPRELADPDSVPLGGMQIPDLHLPGSHSYPLMVIPRAEVEAQQCDYLLLKIVAKAEEAGGLAKLQGRVGFAVDGYNDDRRELFEIPEVRTYFQKLDRRAPHFLFFIANEGNGECVRLYMKMFITPDFFSMEQPPPALFEEFQTFVLSRLNAVTDYCARNSTTESNTLDPVTTAHQAYRACGYEISRAEAKALLDAR